MQVQVIKLGFVLHIITFKIFQLKKNTVTKVQKLYNLCKSLILLNLCTVFLSCLLAIIYGCDNEFNYSSNLMSNPSPFNSCINTLNDSGIPGVGKLSPFTIAS